MATTRQITTAEQLLEAPGLGRCELLRGELVMMTPAGFEHGRIAMRIGELLAGFVRQRGLGTVTGAEAGFQIAQDPDTVRAPDVAFVRAERVPPTPTMGFFQGAPDLAVEVLSPNDRASEVLAKVQDWLRAGCGAVWVVDPATRTVAVYDSLNRMITRTTSDELTGGEVVPEFRLRANLENEWAARVMEVYSVGTAENSPTQTAKTYDYYFYPPQEAAGQYLYLSFDMINFGAIDVPNATLSLESVIVESFDVP